MIIWLEGVYIAASVPFRMKESERYFSATVGHHALPSLSLSEALWIGSHKNTNVVIPSSKPIFWAEEKVYALGVWFSTSRPANIDNNFTEKIEKIKKILGSWSARRLTLMGKIAILKALAVSQIVYVLSSLPTPKGVIKEIDAVLYDFLWDNKGDKIKITEMINDYSKGGLKMIDIASFNQALKMKWVKAI